MHVTTILTGTAPSLFGSTYNLCSLCWANVTRRLHHFGRATPAPLQGACRIIVRVAHCHSVAGANHANSLSVTVTGTGGHGVTCVANWRGWCGLLQCSCSDNRTCTRGRRRDTCGVSHAHQWRTAVWKRWVALWFVGSVENCSGGRKTRRDDKPAGGSPKDLERC